MGVGDIIIKPMSRDFVLWRCLHGGPLSSETIDQLPEERYADWVRHRALNVPLLGKLIEAYESCAMLAWDGEQVVGFLRFYPKALLAFEEAGAMCLQQAHPAGPAASLLDRSFPSLAELADKTLAVHCLMTGSPFQKENPYQRKGIGTRMARALISWARARGWQAIEACAYQDIDILYANTGQAGLSFWGRLGFRAIAEEKELAFRGSFLQTMREEALARGLHPDTVCNRYTMRRDLG